MDPRIGFMNYNQIMEDTIKKLEGHGECPSLLLHSCCAPCSSHVLSVLSPHFNINVLYYNPNIEPYEEYLKRKAEEIRFINEFPHDNLIEIMDCDYDNEVFHREVKGMEDLPEGGERCFVCYRIRLEKTGELAKEKGFQYFSTTLSVSPFKNAAKLNEIGCEVAEKVGVPYLISDFKKKNGYKHSIELSKEYNLYRQDYCGCVFSKRDRDLKRGSSCEKCKLMQEEMCYR